MKKLRKAEAASGPDRWTLIRDVTILHGKLIIDGLRDFVLVPVSIGAGILSLMKAGEGTGTHFYDLLRVGRRSERLINLFGAADRVPGSAGEAEPFPVYDIDEIVTRVESYIVEEYKSGCVTRQAKNRLDQALDILHKSAHRDGS